MDLRPSQTTSSPSGFRDDMRLPRPCFALREYLIAADARPDAIVAPGGLRPCVRPHPGRGPSDDRRRHRQAVGQRICDGASELIAIVVGVSIYNRKYVRSPVAFGSGCR